MYRVSTIALAKIMHDWLKEHGDARYVFIEMAFRADLLPFSTDTTADIPVAFATDLDTVRERLAQLISRQEIDAAIGHYMNEEVPATWRLINCSITPDLLLGTATFVWNDPQ